MITKIALSCTLALFSSGSFASEHPNTYLNWDDSSAITINQEEETIHIASIAQSESKGKLIYILSGYLPGSSCSLFDYGESSDPRRSLVKEVTYIVNNQAVKMFEWCVSEGGGNYYKSATPYTSKGTSFIVNAFKNSEGVFIKNQENERFMISAIGFIKAWNLPLNNPI